jgi:uracil-DNA glycosylase
MADGLEALLANIRACNICQDILPLGPRPMVQVSTAASVLVVGQAPGIKVHETGIPFNDPSGDRLREWMGINREVFYDESKIALVPMGFCFPGSGRYGDVPPPPICAETWRRKLLSQMPNIQLTLVLGQHAQKWHLPIKHKTLTENVRAWESDGGIDGKALIPLPHPSPRNNIWLKKNPWFAEELLPLLRQKIAGALVA